MKCQKCNAELKEGAKFCRNCGAPVLQENVNPLPADVKNVDIQVKNNNSQVFVPPTPGKVKKKSGNGGLIAAIVIMVVLLIAVIATGSYFLFLDEDSGIYVLNKNKEKEVDLSEQDDEEDRKDSESLDDSAKKDKEEDESKAAKEADADADTAPKEWKPPEFREDLIADGTVATPLEYFNPAEHTYELFIEDKTWYEASQLCEQKGGHLASIICIEEKDIIEEYLKKQKIDAQKIPYQIWIGGYKKDEAVIWTTGENPGFSNWYPGEPNFTNPETGAQEDFLSMFYNADSQNWAWQMVSFDISDTYSGHIAYLCEWETVQ